MATDKTQAIFNRILRGIVLAVSAPIILASCFFKLLFEISFQILIAIKLLSAELVNAPLKAYSYFNSTSTPADTQDDTHADTHDDAFTPIFTGLLNPTIYP
jgi:hypothetical protein